MCKFDIFLLFPSILVNLGKKISPGLLQGFKLPFKTYFYIILPSMAAIFAKICTRFLNFSGFIDC